MSERTTHLRRIAEMIQSGGKPISATPVWDAADHIDALEAERDVALREVSKVRSVLLKRTAERDALRARAERAEAACEWLTGLVAREADGGSDG